MLQSNYESKSVSGFLVFNKQINWECKLSIVLLFRRHLHLEVCNTDLNISIYDKLYHYKGFPVISKIAKIDKSCEKLSKY